MNAIRKWASSFGAALLSLLIPDRGKRMVFLASFFASMKEGGDVDVETLAKLNRAMSLAKRDDSLGLAVQLNRAIWNGRSSKELCLDGLNQQSMTPARLRLICTNVIQAMPDWLRYGDESVIREDLVKLFATRLQVLES